MDNNTKEIYLNGQKGYIKSNNVDTILSTHNDATKQRNYEVWRDCRMHCGDFGTMHGGDFFIIPKHDPWIDEDIVNDEETTRLDRLKVGRKNFS